MSKPFNFTAADAQNLVSTAEQAPLINMGAAKDTADLIGRFVVFFDAAVDAIAFQKQHEPAILAEAAAKAEVDKINAKLAGQAGEPPAA